MSDISKIKDLLTDRALSVAEKLLPNGKLEGGEWAVGSLGGEAGQSLKVCVKGDKTGVWRDFAADEGGDLIDLWMKVHRLSLSETLEEARAYLGLERPAPPAELRKNWTRPAKPSCKDPEGPVYRYLCEERGLPGKALKLYKIGEQGRHAIFPFLRDGELFLAKRYPVDPDEKGKRRPVPTQKDCEPILFGWQAIPENAREVVITEGEIDAMSMWAFGFPALSVPFGGGGGAKHQWIENDYDHLDRFERIYIATDMDEPGEQAAREIMNRLGLHRCVRVELPKKDANECLTCREITREQVEGCIRAAKHLAPEGLKTPLDYLEDVTQLFWPVHDREEGLGLPFESLKTRLIFRPGEVTVWTGASGHGKSQLLCHAAVGWIREGGKSCLASFEMNPRQTLRRMVRQASNTDRPSEPMIRKSLDWMSAGLVLFDLVGKANTDRLLEVFDYAHARYGCTQFVIDSLMRLGVQGDDYNGQEAVIFRIVNWAVQRNVHVHLVAHSRKGEKSVGGAPETEDIKGAMEIGANAFNIISVWRNRKLEDQMSKAEATGDDVELEKLRDKAPVLLNVAKQRSGDWEGKVGLWFDMRSYQYRGRNDNRFGLQYVNLDREDLREGLE